MQGPRAVADEAAKALWNDWAEKPLTELKALEASGVWALEKDDSSGIFVAENAATSAWMKRAESDFSRCHFFLRRSERTKEAAGEDKDKAEASDPLVKLIEIDDGIDMRGFVFPGYASFESAAFSNDAHFQSVAFNGDANFVKAAFNGNANFGNAAFSGDADFEMAAFSGDAHFDSVAFQPRALLLDRCLQRRRQLRERCLQRRRGLRRSRL